MTIFAGIAEFERDLIRERTGAGCEAAKKSEASNLAGCESLLWIRVNWPCFLFRKGISSGKLRRFSSASGNDIDSPT